MNIAELSLIGLGLSMDCFAVSLTLGASARPYRKDIIRISAFFAIFQGGMPVLGWLIGNGLQWLIEPVDHWVAFGILALIGLKMVIQAFTDSEKKKEIDIRALAVILSLSLATSIDALITGVGFGFIRVNIYIAATVIALITFAVSLAGWRAGRIAGFLPARWAEAGGGLVLIAIGLKTLLEHL